MVLRSAPAASYSLGHARVACTSLLAFDRRLRYLKFRFSQNPAMDPSEIDIDELVRSHEKALFGYFRARVADDSTAADLAQDTWIEVLRRADTFDPEIAGFWTFAKNWARFVLLRYYERSQRDSILATGGPKRGEDDEPDGISADVIDDERFGIGSQERRNATASAADTLADAERFRLLLWAAMTCRRPPHERIVFGFSRLEWRPAEMVAELSDAKLGDLLVRLQADYRAVAPTVDTSDAFSPLVKQMGERLVDLLRDKRTKDSLAGLLERVVGGTFLREYYAPGSRPEDRIVNWWAAVKLSALKRLESCGRSVAADTLPSRESARAARFAKETP